MQSTAILVLGMHRSGTSALTAALQGLGASLGGELVAASQDNPGGYFENAAAVGAHEALLAELGRGWDDPRDMPEGWLQSPAARKARMAISALLGDEFAGKPVWALKDPRLCRLLPLWRPLLEDAGIQAKCLFVLRHPDEVAASLQKRDGLGADHAYLLWLQYFLDAERDSRGAPRCLLTYEGLLADPVSSLARVGDALAVEWPREPMVTPLSGLLDPGQRHHRPLAEADADGFRKLALEAYAQACRDIWPAGDALRILVRELSRGLTPWLDGPGNALARARLDVMRALQRSRQAEAALEEAKALSLSRLDEVHALDARLQSAEAALEEAKALSLSRLDAVQALDARLQSVDAALEEAKTLSLSRLDEVHALDARLQSVDAALEEAKTLSLSRLDDVHALDARLQSVDAALEQAAALSMSRLHELGVLDARLRSTDAALEETKRLSLSRLSEIEVLQLRVGECTESLARADARHQLDLAQKDAFEQRALIGESLLQELRSSLSWRVTRPLRWLSGLFAGRRTGG